MYCLDLRCLDVADAPCALEAQKGYQRLVCPDLRCLDVAGAPCALEAGLFGPCCLYVAGAPCALEPGPSLAGRAGCG